MIESARVLINVARELDGLSKHLMVIEEQLADEEVEYRIHVENAKVAMMQEYAERGTRMPAEDVRDAMAHKLWDTDRYRKLLLLKAARNRVKGRLTDLREVVAAHRSIVSAAKTELDASEGPQPQYAGSREYPRG